MYQKILDFFSYYTQSFYESDTNALHNMYLLPNTFVFNMPKNEIKEYALCCDSYNDLSLEILECFIPKTNKNHIEILKIHFITREIIMVEANWQHTNDMKIKCLFTLQLVKQDFKIASMIIDYP